MKDLALERFYLTDFERNGLTLKDLSPEEGFH
jgi:hypothetical protein